MERRVLFHERCQLGRDLLMSFLLSQKFPNLDHLAPTWQQISNKISERQYEGPLEFLRDLKPLLDLLKYIHKNMDLQIFQDLLDLSKPLHEIRGLKCHLDGTQRLLAALTPEIVPSSITRLFQGGQLAGRHAARGAPVSANTKCINPSNTITTPSAAASPPLLFTRETQTPPFGCCVAHEKYYGVWSNPIDGKYVAQVRYCHQQIVIGFSFDDPIEAVDRATLRLYGSQYLSADLNFKIQCYLFEQSSLLHSYDSVLRSTLRNVSSWKGFYSLKNSNLRGPIVHHVQPKINLETPPFQTQTKIESQSVDIPLVPLPLRTNVEQTQSVALPSVPAFSSVPVRNLESSRSKIEAVNLQVSPSGDTMEQDCIESNLNSISGEEKDLAKRSDGNPFANSPESQPSHHPPDCPLPQSVATDKLPAGNSSALVSVPTVALSACKGKLSETTHPVVVNRSPVVSRKRSNSDCPSTPLTNTKKVKATPSQPAATPPSKPKPSPNKENEKKEEESSEEELDEEDEWSYFSVLEPTDVLPAKYHHLRSFLGRKFTDLEVRKNDPFKYGCVMDIVQLHGKGPFLFKFYNYLKFPKKPPPENEDNWAYQGCDELIADYENKKDPTYLWQ